MGGKTYMRRVFIAFRTNFMLYAQRYADTIDKLYYAKSLAHKPDQGMVDVVMKGHEHKLITPTNWLIRSRGAGLNNSMAADTVRALNTEQEVLGWS